MTTFVVLTTIAAAVSFLACFLIALVKETIRPRASAKSVQSVGYQLPGSEPGAVIWSAPATVHKVSKIICISGHWQRTAPVAKKHFPETRLKLV